MIPMLLALLLMIAVAPSGLAGQDDVTLSTEPETGLQYWKFTGHGLDLELVQVPPDLIRASYAARGLPSAVSEAVAPHGSRVALKVVWTIEVKRYAKVLSNLECAPAPEQGG